MSEIDRPDMPNRVRRHKSRRDSSASTDSHPALATRTPPQQLEGEPLRQKAMYQALLQRYPELLIDECETCSALLAQHNQPESALADAECCLVERHFWRSGCTLEEAWAFVDGRLEAFFGADLMDVFFPVRRVFYQDTCGTCHEYLGHGQAKREAMTNTHAAMHELEREGKIRWTGAFRPDSYGYPKRVYAAVVSDDPVN